VRTICVTLWHPYEAQTPGLSLRKGDRARAHFAERGVPVEFFYGIDAPKLGVDTKNVYELDVPGSGWRIGPKPTGCWLSHRALWAALLLLPEDRFFVIEDDAIFPPDWKPRFDRAVADAGDFDMLFIGSCCTRGKEQPHVRGEVYAVKYPLCTHGYVVSKKALPVLIETQDAATCYAPIDISIGLHSGSRLRILTLLPRLLEQFETKLEI
jgi:GR25 family glycosyltransferase involved in LPS biosynthesis